jgi:hypothetical protein
MSFGNAEVYEMRKFSTQGGPSLFIAGTVLALVLFVAWLHPHALVLPLLSIIITTAGFSGAAAIWLSAQRTAAKARRTSLEDRLLTPGLIVFAGFAAAIMGDPDLALQSLQQPR